MDFKTFFIKKIMMSFFVSVAGISLAMALIGMIFEPATRFGYEILLYPLFFAGVASLPLLIKYSKKELPLKETAIRNILHFILLEAIILSLLYFGGAISDLSMAISLGISILVIDLAVNLILWVNDQKTARIFNQALKKLQKDLENE